MTPPKEKEWRIKDKDKTGFAPIFILHPSAFSLFQKWEWKDLNLRPRPSQSRALSRLRHIPRIKLKFGGGQTKRPVAKWQRAFPVKEKNLLSTEVRCPKRATTIIDATQIVRAMISMAGENGEHGNHFREKRVAAKGDLEKSNRFELSCQGEIFSHRVHRETQRGHQEFISYRATLNLTFWLLVALSVFLCELCG